MRLKTSRQLREVDQIWASHLSLLDFWTDKRSPNPLICAIGSNASAAFIRSQPTLERVGCAKKRTNNLISLGSTQQNVWSVGWLPGHSSCEHVQSQAAVAAKTVKEFEPNDSQHSPPSLQSLQPSL